MAKIIYIRPDSVPSSANLSKEEYEKAWEKHNELFNKYVRDIKRDFPDMIEEDGFQGMKGMKVKYIGKTNPLKLTYGEIYDVRYIDNGVYCIFNEKGDDSLYPVGEFEIIEKGNGI